MQPAHLPPFHFKFFNLNSAIENIVFRFVSLRLILLINTSFGVRLKNIQIIYIRASGVYTYESFVPNTKISISFQ